MLRRIRKAIKEERYDEFEEMQKEKAKEEERLANNDKYYTALKISQVSEDEQIENYDRQVAVKTAIALLPASVGTACILRFGLIDGSPKTYKEVGEGMNLSAARARDIIEKGSRMIKHPRRVFLCRNLERENPSFKSGYKKEDMVEYHEVLEKFIKIKEYDAKNKGEEIPNYPILEEQIEIGKMIQRELGE